MHRRDFLNKAGVAAAAAVATTGLAAPTQAQGNRFHYKMVTSWPPNSLLQSAAEKFAKRVEVLTSSSITIKVFAGGELVPSQAVFDNVSGGTVEIGCSWPNYWTGRAPAAQWFGSLPFGLDTTGFNTWLHAHGGLKLWNETYAQSNLVVRPYAVVGSQLLCWSRKPLKSMADLKGLKICAPGMAGEVLERAGATRVLLPYSEVSPNLNRGVIDAFLETLPEEGSRLGLQKVTRHVYAPSWQAPGSCMEVMFHSRAFGGLPPALKAAVETAAAESCDLVDAASTAKAVAVSQELEQKHQLKISRLPSTILTDLRKLTNSLLDEKAARDPQSKKVHDSYKKFQKAYEGWAVNSLTM